MKKLLALVLAVVTVLGLSAASFAAAPTYTEDEILDLLVGYHTATYSLEDILPLIGGSGATGYPGYPSFPGYPGYPGGSGYPGTDLSNTILTSWIDTCPEEGCGGIAYYFVEDGVVKWVCTKCKKTGTINPPKPEPETPHEAAVCPTCKKSDKLTYLETGLKEGKLYDIYYCSRCQKLVYVTPTKEDDTPMTDTIICKTHGCGKTAKFQYYYVYDGRLVARYECPNGHTSDVYVNNGSGGWGYYTVTVVSSAGGDYTISGGKFGKFGEKKIITFIPKSGYTLTGVTVDGKAVEVKNNEITIYINGDTVVVPTYMRIADLKDYTITVKKTGNGEVNIAKNAKNLSATTKVTAKTIDTVAISFIPADSAKIVDVKVDGKSVGALKSYTFRNLTADHTVEVTFSGSSTYADVEDKYAAAVDYVTTAKIMGAYKTEGGKAYFCGRTGITVNDLVCALAELTDVGGKLNSDTDRRNWMINYGIVSKKTAFSANCDVQQACTIIKSYLEVLEDLNNITFVKLDRTATVKENAVSLNLTTAKTFDGNRNLHRYDLAAICRLIARLEYKG